MLILFFLFFFFSFCISFFFNFLFSKGKMSSAEVANITKMLYECLEDEEPEE